jgi:hypothetical protein
MEKDCWCMALPPLPAIDKNMDCFCPHCLKKKIAASAGGKKT